MKLIKVSHGMHIIELDGEATPESVEAVRKKMEGLLSESKTLILPAGWQYEDRSLPQLWEERQAPIIAKTRSNDDLAIGAVVVAALAALISVAAAVLSVSL